MHTPGHATVNLALIGSYTDPRLAPWVFAGAVLPDIPIFVLYARERLRRTPEEEIWRVHYQKRFWQDVIHGMHSLPLGALGLALCLWARWSPGAAFFTSALLHALSDLPIHHQDAHRHLWPLSHYRFISPLSYWDVRHHAKVVAAVELTLVAACALLLAYRHEGLVARGLLAMVVVWYVVNYWRAILHGPVPEPASSPPVPPASGVR